MTDRWRSRLRTAEAMVALSVARALVATTPFRHWRRTLGGVGPDRADRQQADDAARFAAHVDWAARRLPFATKCLPRAMALSWMLRSRGIGHCVVFAVRPAGERSGDDQLHAWVEASGRRVLGDLPGPWVETLRQGSTIR